MKITLNWRHAVAATLLALGFAMFATTIADNYGVLFAMPPSAITLSEACRVFASFVLSIVVINSSLDAMPAHPRGDR